GTGFGDDTHVFGAVLAFLGGALLFLLGLPCVHVSNEFGKAFFFGEVGGRHGLPHFPLLNIGGVFALHLLTFGGDLVAVHGTDLVHGSVDCVLVVAVLGLQFILKEFWHGKVSSSSGNSSSSGGS